MAKYTDNDVSFSGIRKPVVFTGSKMGVNPDNYQTDEEGNIIGKPGSIIDAINIDWNNATIDNIGPIKTTGDLINAIANKGSGAGGDPNSIPLYDTSTINNLKNKNKLPNKYIDIDESLTSMDSLNMIHQLLNVVNNLQQEIIKIKNTFNKGIYSYNGEATYMSTTVAQYGDDEEPLWAIDESELDEIEGFEFDYENNTVYVDNGLLSNCNENRMYAYITSNSNLNIQLKSKDNSIFEFNISDYVTCEKCNVMILISRKPFNKNYPSNFVYIDITDYNSNKTLLSGYLDNDKQLVIDENELGKSYYFNSIELLEGNFDKFNIYVQNKSFGNEVIPVTPNDDETSYRVAHIAVRTVKNADVIKKIKHQLVNGEFIVNEETEKLYLKINDKIINIGAGSGGDDIDDDPIVPPTPDDPETDTMENYEIIKALEAQGILSITFIDSTLNEVAQKYDPSNIKTYKMNSLGSVRFTHEDTGKTYEYKTNAYGELESKLIQNETTLAEKLQGAIMFDDFKSSRGFVGQLGHELAQRNGISLSYDSDYGLYSDRIKIGAIYGPLSTDVTYGCSHAFIELENTSNIDFNLEGCKLHYIKKSETSDYYIKYSLDLTGIIPAGGTYLIRGKKYIQNDEDSNCFIHVNHYDQEWYVNGELLDLTMDNSKDSTDNLIYGSYVLILSYHGKVKTESSYTDFLKPTDMLYKLGEEINETTISNNSKLRAYLGSKDIDPSLKLCGPNDGQKIGFEDREIPCKDENDTKKTNAPLVYAKGFIDALAFNTIRFNINSAFDKLSSNTIYRGTYELDPAKQAYNSFTKRDSSRNRWEKNDNDFQYLNLNKEYIEFPKSETTRDVNYYTPKASFEHKNVITDKTKFDKEKPNAVTVSLGTNIYTTRCFNWLSASNTDEYVWIYDSNGTQIGVFESYKYTETDIEQQNTFPRRKEFPKDVNNIVYCDYRINDVIDRSNQNKDVTYKKYATAKRACGLFAGSNDFFVSHKCIVNVVENSVNDETTYSYIVGQADKNKKPLEGHCSERRYFTLYPDTYTPVIYQVTDQQGFHWIEYQVWAAAAESLNQKIINEMNAAKTAGHPIMPIIINTGDCTQSGSRINEWLDYFIAGDCLFNHFEQNNIVGNNDLCCTDIQALGTGDDPGKSNGYYFYLFNCNEVNNFFTKDGVDHYPIVNNTYVPSLYYLDANNCRLVMCNSELTPINCRDWFNLRCTPYEGDANEYTINIYTGFNLVGSNNNVVPQYVADTFGFTPIYTLLWHAFNKSENGNKKCIAACHEMPFTVITNACCTETDQLQRFRSMSDAKAPGKLIGSHMNQLEPTEIGAGVYWFSRLLESSGVKLCIGGHKHTYAISYPVREYYKYKVIENDQEVWKNSRYDGPMNMEETLENDANVTWKWNAESQDNTEYSWYNTTLKENKTKYTGVINWSKLPLTYVEDTITSNLLPVNKFYPATPIYPNVNKVDGWDGYRDKAVTYIMCQATGYKLTSNKELPTPNQKFSRIIPITFNGSDGTDTPDNNQKFPMYIKYIIDNSGNCDVYLGRVANIFDSYKFTQSTYSTEAIQWHYLIDKKQYVESEDKTNIIYTKKYKNDTSGKDALVNNATVYDNYGLWLNKEKKMIDTIML